MKYHFQRSSSPFALTIGSAVALTILVVTSFQIGVPHLARADDDEDICLLPVCDLPAAWDEFKAMKESGRILTLNGFSTDFQTNTDAANAENLVAYVDGIQGILKEENQAPTSDTSLAATRLAEQSLTQSSLYHGMKDRLASGFFSRLNVGSNRYLVLDTWVGQIASFNEPSELQNLIAFFADAEAIVTAAGDEAYVVNRAKTGWAQANVRMAELTPPIGWTAPLTDPEKAEADFLAMDLPTRMVLVRELATRYPAETATGLEQVSLARFLAGSALPILQDAGETQAELSLQTSALLGSYIDRLPTSSDIPAGDMTWVYTMLAGPTPKYAMIQYWSSQIASATEMTLLDKLAAFFADAKRINVENKEEDYMVAVADRAEQDTYVRMISIGKAPELALPIATAEELDDRVAEFEVMNPALKFLLLEDLAAKHTEGELGQGNTPILLSLIDYAKRILPIAEAMPSPQSYVHDEAQSLLDAALELAASAWDTPSDTLIALYKQLPTAQSRADILYYWGSKIDGLTVKSAAIRLYKFFVAARKVCIEKGDNDTVIRDAQSFEQKTKAKIAELSGS